MRTDRLSTDPLRDCRILMLSKIPEGDRYSIIPIGLGPRPIACWGHAGPVAFAVALAMQHENGSLSKPEDNYFDDMLF